MLPSIEESLSKFNDFDFYILTFDHSKKIVEKMINGLKIKILTDFEKKQSVMKESFIAIAASGSVSLELCKFQVPTIVVYDTHFITKIILKLFVKVKFASLINIFYDKEVIPEFLFERFTKINVFKKITELIENKNVRNNQIRMMRDFSNKMLLKKKNPAHIIVDSIFK